MENTSTLKTIPAIAFFLMCNYAFSFSGDKKKQPTATVDPEVCLEVSGNLAPEMKIGEGTYTVKLIQDNKTIEEIIINGNEKFKLHLKRNCLYTIKVEKAGFIPRLVSVSTQMPVDAKKINLYRFHFDIELFAEMFSKYFDADDIDFPIALISYDYSKRLFNYDKDYTLKIQEKMHGMSSTAR